MRTICVVENPETERVLINEVVVVGAGLVGLDPSTAYQLQLASFDHKSPKFSDLRGRLIFQPACKEAGL